MTSGTEGVVEVPNSGVTDVVDMSGILSALEASGDENENGSIIGDEGTGTGAGEGTGAGTGTGTGEGTGTGSGSGEGTPDAAALAAAAAAKSTEEELATLRTITRNQARDLRLLQDKVNRHEAVQKGDIGSENEVPLGDAEKLSEEIEALSTSRAGDFTLLLETMEVNPKYEDVKSVCSRDNLDDIIHTAATNLSAKTGEDVTILTLKMEKEIWSQPNPYKYMYEMIKTYHPKYTAHVAAGTGTGTSGGTGTTSGNPRENVVVPAPGSVHNIGGGNENPKGAGWTSEKIDALSEAELGQVPADIYEKYLMNQLP